MQTDEQTNLRPLPYTPKFVPIQTLIDLAKKGLNGAQIGKIVGISKAAVSQAFKRHNYIPDHLRAYQSAKAEVFDHYQDQVLRTFTPADLKKAPFASRVMLFGVLYDKARLERGQSTTNIQALTALITSIHAPQPLHVVVSAQEPISIDRTVAEQEAIDVPVQSIDLTPDPVTPDD